jgi:hypothetical protein
MELCEVKNWGNSKGIIIPKKVVQSLDLKPHDEVIVEFSKKEGNPLRKMFGSNLFNGESTEKIIREARKDLASKWD